RTTSTAPSTLPSPSSARLAPPRRTMGRLGMVELPKLQVSFSGGRSSALMAYLVKKHWSNLYDLRFVFCNTSFEDPRTLDFVDAVDREFGLNLVWLEAVANHDERKSSGHRVVTYQTAARNGEVFR